MRYIKLLLPMPLILVLFCMAGCNNDSKAQEDFFETFSGPFVSGPMSTDTNNDGKPATIPELEGDSTFGPVSIQAVNEFMVVEPTGMCPPGNVELTLVRGNFIKRFADTGELLFGTWTRGRICEDPVTKTSESTQTGGFSGGTGRFANATGHIEIKFTSTNLVTPVEEGFLFGGSVGTGTGTLTLQ
ncbi:hypothetical protein MYX76_16015 [Desulfobacterota bacterium AH_259_B03_O07]|nr:hypothetical protein [Desulfobacterota bacterium AH_259_B03_O07]